MGRLAGQRERKEKKKGEEGKSWAGPKTREREKSFEIKIKQI